VSGYRRHDAEELAEWADLGELWVCDACGYETHVDHVGAHCPACLSDVPGDME
jgi:rubrerythrin